MKRVIVSQASSVQEQLIVRQLPQQFQVRYSQIPEIIYVRECYRKLYEIVADLMSGELMEWGATLFTGVPGIGKSLFLVYFIYRFLHDDRFPDKRFALELVHNNYICFSPTPKCGVFKCTEQDRSSNCLLLCDVIENVEPLYRGKWTFIFSSPAPGRYKEIMKNGPNYTYTMPTWSEQELMFVNSNIAEWYDNFVHFGGVPRYVIPKAGADPKIKLDESLADKGGKIAEDFFKFSFGTIDSLQSYMLVHINPPVSANGDFQYDGRKVYSFASDIIFQKLVDTYESIMLAGAIGIFNSGVAEQTYGSVSAGNLFEKICLWLKPLEGRITATSLEKGPTVTFNVPEERHILSHDWKKSAQLPVNKLILPRISNLESGDAFYVEQRGPNNYVLVIFQITVGKSHPVKVNGLKDIWLAYPQVVRDNFTSKALVFVTPTHGHINKKQKLCTQKIRESAKLPLGVRGFQQFVYRYNI